MCTNNSEKSTEEKGEMDAETSSSKSSSLKIILRYADRLDILLMVLGTFGAVGDGLSTNCLLVYVSRLFNSLGFGNSPQNHGQFMHEIEKCSLYFVYLGLAVMAVAFMEGYCWSKTSERQVLRIRYKYLEAVLRQEVGFFDSQEATTSEIINSISKDTSLIQELLSEKVPIFLMNMSMFVSGLAFSAYFSWKLALVAFPTIILLIIPGLIYGKYLVYLSKKSFNEYAKANTIVGQALSSIKTVYAFTAERRIIEKYSSILDGAKKLGIKQGIAKGLAIGSTGLSFAIWGLLAWYGSRLIMYKGESGGRIYAAGVSFVLGGLALGAALPEVKYFTEASVAASRIFQRIDRIPQIDTNNGLVLEKIRGEIEFERVQFTYPSRPDALVLNNFSLKIEAGKTVALVGASGSGKSTAIALVQRFYDASGGSVRIDGVDIRSLQLKWLREQMGLVSQEHALFGTSVRENILFGKLDATMDDVVAAAMAANAHNFIRQLPQGYETKIGERGSLLSGGQKQRIAIARAIIRNPVILLLDEATSALDSESETLVQNALDQASMGRTTLVVAHKLSTVRNADVIAVVSGGSIVEIGSHYNLIKTNGHYARLVKLQRQFSALDQDQSIVEPRFSSAARSSGSRRSSPASFASPLSIINNNNNNNNNNNYNNYPPPSMYRLLSLNSPEWKQAVIGSLSAVIFGTVQPLYALTIGGMISAFFSPSHAEMKARIERYALIFSSLCLVSITLNLCQHYNFAYMGECLTRRIRLRMLEKMLTFEAAWFDQEQNSSAALCFRLSNEAAMVKSIIADRLSLLIQTTSAVTTAMIIGLIIAWKLALVMIAVQPLTIFCFYTRKVILSTITGKFVKAQNKSTQIAAEAVYNHRTVTSFGSIRKVLEIFDEAQDEPRKEARKKSWLAGAGIGSAQGLTFICWALDFWYGGTLVSRGEISAGDVFRTFFILVSTGKVVAEAGSMTSDLAKGSAAVASIFAILDRQSLILGSYNGGDSDENKGMKLEKMRGGIEIKRVDFAYPGRPQTLVLRDFSLEVKEGTSIGLVGKSGCGKSTVIALIQRFYDVDCGSIKVDGVGIRLLDIEWYRKRMALVSQDPVIYSGSIRDNILLGKIDASENEVVEAARSANAHEFICALKNGYETECGERGVQLSGGQKQRIAIARAILRDPIILLLDEATSALDVQSEQLVQEALDRVMVGRTTVVVAHRLNTIKNLDSIAVVMDGKVVERGSYSQLKNKRGAFFNLASISVAIQGGVSRPL